MTPLTVGENQTRTQGHTRRSLAGRRSQVSSRAQEWTRVKSVRASPRPGSSPFISDGVKDAVQHPQAGVSCGQAVAELAEHEVRVPCSRSGHVPRQRPAGR